MKKMIMGAAALVGMTFGLGAHASCADPGAASAVVVPELKGGPLSQLWVPKSEKLEADATADVSTRIVGTWIATYDSFGSYFATAFIQWHSDHTEWESISQPTLGGNICVGSWVALDASHVFRRHFGWLFHEGELSGYFIETETDEVASDGMSYKGTNETRIYNNLNELQITVPGTSVARKAVP